MNRRIALLGLVLALGACSGATCYECKSAATGVVTLIVKDDTGTLVSSPTFSENGTSITAICNSAAVSPCPSWDLRLEPGEHSIAVTDGSSGVATSVPIDVVPRSCLCDEPASISMTVQLLSA